MEKNVSNREVRPHSSRMYPLNRLKQEETPLWYFVNHRSEGIPKPSQVAGFVIYKQEQLADQGTIYDDVLAVYQYISSCMRIFFNEN